MKPDHRIPCAFSEQEITPGIRRIAKDIVASNVGGIHATVFVVVKEGALRFWNRLQFEIEKTAAISIDPRNIVFVTAKSYDGVVQNGVQIDTSDGMSHVKDKQVVIVEDIVDTGRTITAVKGVCAHFGAADVRCVALLRRDTRKHSFGYVKDMSDEHLTNALMATYSVYNDCFYVGFGMDYRGKFRDLPYIGVISKDVQKQVDDEIKLEGALEAAKDHRITPEEHEAQRQSWARAAVEAGTVAHQAQLHFEAKSREYKVAKQEMDAAREALNQALRTLWASTGSKEPPPLQVQ